MYRRLLAALVVLTSVTACPKPKDEDGVTDDGADGGSGDECDCEAALAESEAARQKLEDELAACKAGGAK